MPALICNLPSYEVWVRKEYLTDHKSGHGEFVKGVWVSAKSIPGRAFYFETYLPEYAAMFDKLPISAFVSDPETPKPDMELHNLQFWNCMDYGVVAVQKQFVGSMHYEVLTRDYGTQTGTYICTLDNYHQDVDAIDYSTSEQPAEHKSHNLIELDNGQFIKHRSIFGQISLKIKGTTRNTLRRHPYTFYKFTMSTLMVGQVLFSYPYFIGR